MTESNKMRIVSTSAQTEEEAKASLRVRVNDIVDQRRKRTIELVGKAIVFYTEIGHTEIYLHDLPKIDDVDQMFVAAWLEGEGFRVTRKRFGGRPMVSLLKESA